jgi:large subunit ribosomal protein L18
MAVLKTKRISSETQRVNRVRAKIKGALRPRLSINRSNKYITAQLIQGDKTLAYSTSQGMKLTGRAAAEAVGVDISKKIQSIGITEVVFDRGGLSYEGNIKALAEAARSGGLNF